MNTKGTILIIDDEKDLIEMVRYNLEKEGFDVIAASDGQTGLEISYRHKVDLVLLDVMMPGMDGLEVCRRLRTGSRTVRIPILMLTAKATEADRVVGLELGADDYVTKPFSVRELMARVKALLRRSSVAVAAPEVVRCGKLVIDLGRHEVICDGHEITLTATEFKILHYMASRPGRVVTREDIIEAAIDPNSNVFDRTIDVHVTAIRRKLGQRAAMIETVRGFGYKFRDDTAVES